MIDLFYFEGEDESGSVFSLTLFPFSFFWDLNFRTKLLGSK